MRSARSGHSVHHVHGLARPNTEGSRENIVHLFLCPLSYCQEDGTSISVSTFNIARGAVTILLTFVDICHFHYIFTHVHTNAHTLQHTRMLEWREPVTEA